MIDEKKQVKTTNSFQSWIITLSIFFFSFSSVVLALICIYALPDKSVKPLEGGLFFVGGVIVLISFLFFRWKKEISILPNKQINVKENTSDKIIKWLTTFFCFFYSLIGIAIALICIYSLPDKTSQPVIGLVYSLGSAIVVACFIFVVWKNWSSKRQ